MPKNLFEDTDLFGDKNDDEIKDQQKSSGDFKVNKDFAEKFDQVKRRQELQRLESKLGKHAGDDDDGEDEEDEEEAYQGPEDEDAELITDQHETEFANLLLKLRQDDPDLKNPEVKFFSEIDEEKARAAKEKKKFTLKDEYQRTVLKNAGEDGNNNDDDDQQEKNAKNEDRRLKARTSDEKKAKMAFLEADAATGEDNVAAKFAIKKASDDNTVDETEEDRLARKALKKKKKALDRAFAVEEQDDADEAFLKTFFREERWKQEDDDDDEDEDGKSSSNKKSKTGDKNNKKGSLDDWEERMKEEQDEQFYDDAEIWEQEYQQALYRHQEGEEALKIQTFPRQQEEGLLRHKDTTRAEARQRKAERGKEEETKLESEVKRLKHLKRQEIDAQRNRIAAVAGIPEAKMKQLAKLLDDELSGGADFDAGSFDKIMENMFNDDYYDNIDDDELHKMELEQEDVYDEEDDEDFLDDDDDEEDEDANQDAAEETDDGKQKKSKNNKKKQQNQKGDEQKEDDDEDEDEDILYPTRFAEKHMEQLAERAREEKNKNPNSKTNKKNKTIYDDDSDDNENADKTFSTNEDVKGRLKKQLDRKVDEYWRLHFEDVLADGTKTRFKYRQVPAESFGLSDEAILTTDDRTLNMIAPMNCYASYLTQEQNKKDRFRSMHRAENMRFLDPTRKTRRYKADTVAIKVDEIDDEQAQKISEAARKLAEEATKANEKGNINNNNSNNKVGGQHQPSNNHQQHQKHQNKNTNSNNNHHRQQQNQQQPHQQKFNNNNKHQNNKNKNNNNQQQQQQQPPRESGQRRQREQ